MVIVFTLTFFLSQDIGAAFLFFIKANWKIQQF